jgi:thiol-disulfide isomerase/thioredoxin
MRALITALVLASLLFSVPSAIGQEAGDADAVLANLAAVEFPSYEKDRREEEGYMESFFAQRAEAEGQRAELVGELFAVEPGHEKLTKLMPSRWQHLLRSDIGTAVGEMDAVIAAEAPEGLVNVAYYWKGQAAMAERDADAMALATDAFRTAYPDDDQGGRMLDNLASLYGEEPERAVAAYRALIEGYPEYRNVDYIHGKIRQVEQLGQPFALAFDDATSDRRIDLVDLHGKVVVVDFWATWCGPCVAEMPHMKELYAEFAPQGVEFVGVSLDSPEEEGGLDKLKAYVADNQIPWPQYYQGNGWKGEFSVSWGINSIPALFVVDREGKLASVKARGELETMLPQLLGSAN